MMLIRCWVIYTTPECFASRRTNMTNWRSDGRQLYATREGLEVSAELPVRGQYTNARAWLRLLGLEIIFLTNRIEIESNKNGV